MIALPSIKLPENPWIYAGSLALAVVAAVGLWINILYGRIERLQDSVVLLEREAAQLEIALQDVELDNARVRAALVEQSAAVEAMREKMLGERERADAAVEALANQPTPPAAEGAGAMLDWWNDHVVR